MPNKYCVVITTINHPTRAVKEITASAHMLGAEIILIGDKKSPDTFYQEGATYLSLDAQKRLKFRYAQIAPDRHYARKNIGYLLGIQGGANVIIETDDDNIPYDSFWNHREATVNANLVEGREWTNVYSYFSRSLIWPRGLPLDHVSRASPAPADGATEAVYCPIQQGLADKNPDVDAIYRLILPLPLDFDKRHTIALRGAWCPFNSQNTTWWPEAFPLLYLPYHCSFRMTDIWRSFVAQKIAYLNGWGIAFHNATVFQERNDHSLMRDFEEEVPGYLHNDRIKRALDELDLPVGAEHVGRAMSVAYAQLAKMELVGRDELPLLEAWLDDLCSLRKIAA